MNDEWNLWFLPILFFNHAELSYDVIINIFSLKEYFHTNVKVFKMYDESYALTSIDLVIR